MLLLFKDSGTMFALFMYAVKVLGGVQKGTSWKEAPFGASYVRGCAQEIGRRDGTGETERPKPERRFGKGKLTERGRGVGNFATLGYDRD